MAKWVCTVCGYVYEERIHRQSVRYATLAQINSRRLREI